MYFSTCFFSGECVCLVIFFLSQCQIEESVVSSLQSWHRIGPHWPFLDNDEDETAFSRNGGYVLIQGKVFFLYFFPSKEFFLTFVSCGSDAWAFPFDGDDELPVEAAQPYNQGYIDSRFFSSMKKGCFLT